MNESFEKEALAHAEALYRFARRMVNHSQEAEDLVQETYLQALRKWHQYESGTNCKAWLFRILHNQQRQKWRKTSSRKDLVPLDQDDDEFYLHAHLLDTDLTYRTNPEKCVLDKMPSEKVTRALQILSEQQRNVLLLCDVEEFSYQEVSDTLDVPIGTVRSRLNRARHKVQNFLIDLSS